MSAPPFRFGLQVSPADADDLVRTARRAEAAGFDVLSTADHVGMRWSPLSPLHAAAAVTERLRVCPMVLNNDFWHPVHLAREISSIDHLTGGRVELGLGAGHAFTEYAAIGMGFDPPSVRKRRLAESVEILRRLLDGETVSFDGEHHHLADVPGTPSLQEHLPILVGVNGREALAHAAVHADAIGLTMLGRTLEDGHRHDVRWEADRLDATIAYVAEHAADRSSPLELNALVQRVVVTDDRRGAAEAIIADVPTLHVDDALVTPFLALGTHDQIADHLRTCRERWGISYFTVRDLDGFAPVIERLSGG